MAHFFDGEPDFLKSSRLRTMVEKSFEKKDFEDTTKQTFFPKTILNKTAEKTQKEKQEKFFEDHKNR